MQQLLDDFEHRHGLDRLAYYTRNMVVVSFSVMIVLSVYRGIAVQPDEFSWHPIIVFTLPLLLFLPTVIGKRPRGHAWLSFVSLLYFTQGIMVATVPSQAPRGLLEAVVALVLFTGCMGYSRYRSRQLKRPG